MPLKDILFHKQRAVEDKLVEYLDHWWECVTCFEQAMTAYLAEGPGEQIDYFYGRIDKEESRSDELRKSIERELYLKALLPESRGDILRSLEVLDKVINRAESTVRQIVIERLEVEPFMLPGLARLSESTVESCRSLHAAAGHVLRGEDDPVAEFVERVDRAETRCDHIEEDLIGRLFSSQKLALSRKLQLKDFVRRVGSISDLAEAAGDSLMIVSIKRRV